MGRPLPEPRAWPGWPISPAAAFVTDPSPGGGTPNALDDLRWLSVPVVDPNAWKANGDKAFWCN